MIFNTLNTEKKRLYINNGKTAMRSFACTLLCSYRTIGASTKRTTATIQVTDISATRFNIESVRLSSSTGTNDAHFSKLLIVLELNKLPIKKIFPTVLKSADKKTPIFPIKPISIEIKTGKVNAITSGITRTSLS